MAPVRDEELAAEAVLRVEGDDDSVVMTKRRHHQGSLDARPPYSLALS